MEAIELVEIEVKKDFHFEDFYEKYKTIMDEFVQGLRDRLPSKKAELTQAEANRIEQERLAKEAENQRIEQERLDKEAREAKTAKDLELAKEQQRLADIRAEELRRQQEAQRLENERLAKEAEARRVEQEQENEKNRLAEEEKNRQEAELKSAALKAGNLFDEIAASGEKQVEGEVRKGWSIRVVVPAGWALIFQTWFTGKAVGMDSDKMGNVKLDQMKAYCEDIADTTKIVSPYLVYEETVTAINRKERAKKKAE